MKIDRTLSSGPNAVAPRSASDAVYGKITARLVPLLFLCYLTAFINRNNIGLAKLQMQTSLGFSDAVYGIAASMFFIGILLFEVPSNLLLRRIGARTTILRIMMLWGITAAATLFVTKPLHFYVLRFLLGAFEAGFFPGVILYLTFWFPEERRARVIALFMTAAAAAGLVTGPVSGLILKSLNHVWGLDGWQWLMLLEGLPSMVLGIVAFFVLPEKPANARWLSLSERRVVQDALHGAAAPAVANQPLRQVLRDPHVYLLGFTTFSLGCATNLLIFWMPSIIEATGISDLQHVGLYVLIPNLLGTIAMVIYGRHSDRHQERRWHFIVTASIGAAGVAAIALLHATLVGVLIASVAATCGVASAYPIFWAITTRYLSSGAAAAGIALISSIGALAGTSSALVGAIKAHTGSLDVALYLVAAQLVAGILVLAVFVRTDASDMKTQISNRETR
ncbi:MFS transporter [Burkholderia anthina]|uniref:MFS transporter n=1 Tax=Burkholderia anthina TaxID=179879 RepID=UPI001CF4A818|nr:MFS transporter [Burkholderia anthina]MCA8092538.1 MFS transporter [Burkholderia anthina]